MSARPKGFYKDEHGKLIKEGFHLVLARDFVPTPSQVIDTVGVYAILVKGADRKLCLMGYDELLDGKLWRINEYAHIYTGESYGVASRAMEHMTGTRLASNFRDTLLALEDSSGVSWSDVSKDSATVSRETILSDWLFYNALLAFKPCNFVGEVERKILARSPSPLNVRDRKPISFTSTIEAARENFGHKQPRCQKTEKRHRARPPIRLLHSW